MRLSGRSLPFEELQRAPSHVITIAVVEDVRRQEMPVEGQVLKLFDPSHSKIAWVGLLEDDSGRIKLMAWKKSTQPPVEESDRIRVRNAARSFYQGHASIAATGKTRITFLN